MKRLASIKLLALGMVFVSVLSLSCCIVPVHASEPSLIEIFNYLGFTNVAETTVETFPEGTYNITLYAEFAGYCDENNLSSYEIGTSIFTVIFTGPEGGFGYVSPPITKTFAADCQFGLSLLSHGYRYFTETPRNPDGQQHANVYRNLDNPNMFLIGFDERTYCDGRGDKDYNDMVFSLQLQYYLTVVSPYTTPGGEGWYYNGTNAFASLVDGVVDHGNETRRLFTYWSGDAYGTNYSKSEPIYMNQDKTATANWKTQYYLTVQTDPSGLSPAPTPSSGWYDKDTDVVLTAPDTSYLNSDEYSFGYWDVDGTSQGTSVNHITLTMNEPHTATAHYHQIITYTLTITTTTGGTTNPAPGTYTYTADSSVEVTAIPDADYIFDHWKLDGVDVGSDNPYSMLMDKDRTLNAVFAYSPPPPPLSVSTNPLSASILVGDSISFTSTVSGGVPPYTYQWYLNGSAVSGATSPTWTFTPVTAWYYIVYLNVTDSVPKTAKSNEATVRVAPPLTVSISPASASILVSQSVTFTSTVSGGYSPYGYQWYLGGTPVSGATSSSWTFTPTASGIYYVYLEVTDANKNTAQSETARITVGTVPVGGYSISLTQQTPASHVVAYTMLIALFGAVLILTKRKRK